MRRRRADLVHEFLLEIAGRWHRWTIDKGPSPSPHEARPALACDSLESIDRFEEGRAFLVWDFGTYESRIDPVEGIGRGKLLFDLRGFKVKGTWTLARGRGRPSGRGKRWIPSQQWSLLKKPDVWADPKGHYSTLSVLSGLAPDDDPTQVRDAFIAELPHDRPRAPRLDEIEPMVPGDPSPPFSSPEWFFELDPEGIPVLASRDGLRAQERDLSEYFPEIAAALDHLPIDVILDGELVILDESGCPDAAALAKRLAQSPGQHCSTGVLFTFDLLAAEQRDLRSLALQHRKQHLRRLLPRIGPLLYADHLPGHGDALVHELHQRGGFGIIARHSKSEYLGGASHLRVPIHFERSQGPIAESVATAERGLEGLKVRLSNLEKVFWPNEGITKGDLLRYYRAVAPWLLPHLRDRPLVLTRYPDGINGKNFFQHNAPGTKSAWLRTVRIQMSKRPRDYFLADDLESLLYLVNLGTIPLHVWPSRVADLDRPDWCTIDIDPGEHGFGAVVRTAVTIRELCDAIGLPSFPKTSGASGMHVLLPLAGKLTFDQSRALGELIARSISAQHPEHATIELQIQDRQGRVYLDHLVNARGRMLVAPYAVRPLPGATVSTPLDWTEVTPELDPTTFTIETVPVRLADRGDPWKEFLTMDVDVVGAIERMSSRIR